VDEHHVFSAEVGTQPTSQTKRVGDTRQLSETLILGAPHRVKTTVLRDNPVDVLAVDEGRQTGTMERYWERWLQKCSFEKRPDLVVICASPNELVQDGGFHEKEWREKFRVLGYLPGFWFLRATDHGGVVRQDRLVLILQKEGTERPILNTQPTPMTSKTPRPATNMLKTHLIPFQSWDRHGWDASPEDETIVQAAAPCVIVGTARVDGRPVFSPMACLPDGTGSWIHVTDLRGKQCIRRLLPEELAKAKGIPAEWLQDVKNPSSLVDGMTALHLWTAVGDTIHETWFHHPKEPSEDIDLPTVLPVGWLEEDGGSDEDEEEWVWTPPDLSEGGEWYQARVESLEIAIAGMENASTLRQEGLEAL